MKQRNNSKKTISALLGIFLTANLFVGGLYSHPVEASPRLNMKPTISGTPVSPTSITRLPIQQSPLVFPKPDLMAPDIDLSTLSASKSLAEPGDLVKIRVKVTDDNTGIQVVAFTLDNENGGHRNFKLTRPEDDGYYTVDFLVDENTHHGQWTLKFIEAADNNGNHRFYNSLTDELSRASFKVNNPRADMTAPYASLSSLKVNKETLVPGDTVKIGIMASDEKTQVELVQFSYINENNSGKTLVATGKEKDGFYYGITKIDENTHSGKWTLANIRVVDSNDNIRNYSSYDLDLSKGNFEVINPSVDMEAPIIDLSSLSISRRTAYPGDQVIYKVKASDLKSGIDYVEFELVNESGAKYTVIDKTKDSQGFYSFTFNVYDTTQPGKWHFNGVSAYDKNNNFTGYWASDVDFAQYSLQVIESKVSKNPLDVIYVNRDTAWNYQVIEGDVYIGPDAHVLMGDVTIKGNLFVLGSVESFYRLRANKAFAKSFNQDGETSRAHGALNIVEGSYEFDLVQSEQPIPSIPLLVTSENQVTSKGILPALDGGTLPLGKLYLDGAPVTYNYNGTFNLTNLDVANQTQVELALVDVFGKTHRTLFELDNPYFAPSVNTIAGRSRFYTAAMISQASHQSSETAIVVQSNNFPDALAAGPLAYHMDAPILLTKTNELHSVTEAELKRLKAKHVVIMGGDAAVSPEVETAIKKLGITVERISGSNRYGTAVDAANKLYQIQAKRNSAVLASGQNFPDALAAGSFAAREGLPILLTHSLRLTERTSEFLSKANIKELYLIGGSAVISENVEKELRNKGIKITRISGTNRADTSRLIAERYFPATSTAFVANGFSFADGLAAAPYAAKLNAPVLLVGDKAISSSLVNHLKNSAIKSITVVGGEGAVGPKVLSELRDAIK